MSDFMQINEGSLRIITVRHDGWRAFKYTKTNAAGKDFNSLSGTVLSACSRGAKRKAQAAQKKSENHKNPLL